MSHTVAHRSDLLHAVDHMALAAYHLVQDHIESILVGEKLGVLFHRIAPGGLIAVLAVDADALADALAQNRFVFHADQLILEGRAARIDYQNIHRIFLLWLCFHRAPPGLDSVTRI